MLVAVKDTHGGLNRNVRLVLCVYRMGQCEWGTHGSGLLGTLGGELLTGGLATSGLASGLLWTSTKGESVGENVSESPKRAGGEGREEEALSSPGPANDDGSKNGVDDQSTQMPI